MRILYVTAHFPPDFVSGATLQVQRLARETARLGHEVTVLAGSIRAGLADGVTTTEVVDGVTVRWIGTSTRIEQDIDGNWINPHATAATIALLDEWRPDVVHAHALQTLGAELLSEAADRAIPTFVTMHDLWWWCSRLFLVDRQLHPCPISTADSPCPCARDRTWRVRRSAALAQVLDEVDQILVPSAAIRNVVIANGVAADRVLVDENDVDRAHRLAAPTERRATAGPVRFLYIGGDHPLKGRDVMVAAVRTVRARDGWRLALHGVDPPPRRWARRWRRVTFPPPYPPEATAETMAGADVLIIPSIARESYSLAAREALAAGLAVITSDCLGPEEVVEHGRNGVVVPTGDGAALADAMDALIADRHLLHRLQQGALADPPRLRDPGEHAATLVARYVASRPGTR